ncbi:hypothetical protein vseg_000389 [Gypsophila vaccaria]
MGYVLKLVDAILFLFFLLKATGGPIFDALFCIPQVYHPTFLVNIRSFYVTEFGDYMVLDKPYFYVGLAWVELCILWPLSVINLFGLVCGKSWFKTTCLVHGVTLTTIMVAIISELVGSDKASDKLKNLYYTFMGLCILVTLRGLFSSLCETSIVGHKSPLAARKKRA